MAMTLTYKILKAHLVDGALKAGAPIGIHIDQTLTQDITGTMAMMEYELMGAPKSATADRLRRPATEISVNYVDHNMMQLGFENADDHEFLRTFSARHGMYFSKPGNGICHQVHLERFSAPGKTLLGADSHTPTSGGAGMIAIGAGGLDVALAIAGRPFYLECPKVMLVKLSGRLRPFVTAKDVILKILSILTTKGNVGWVVEYGGPGVRTLSVPERATITNMGAELGVTTSVFPADEMTRRFLKLQGRQGAWPAGGLAADRGAKYDRTIKLDLAEVEPMVACPHSPDNVKTVREVGPIAVNQVCIGSCTNSSLRDLLTAAALLKGRSARPEVSFVVAPGSRQVLETIARQDALYTLIAAGARIDEAACGFCIGAAQAPQTGAVSVRTSNRNFEGRSGTRSAGVYLASPETAVACALTGCLTDPRDLGIPYPKVREPARLVIDDSMILAPAAEPEKIEVVRGPNLVRPERMDALPDRLSGPVALVVGDKITTDHIMPAGHLAIYRSNVPKYAQYVFNRVDSAFADRCLAARDSGKANFIVAGLSYGQGSSREHAALCPRFLGVRAVLARSIERIHQANLINFGILPLVFADPKDAEKVHQGDVLELDGLRAAVAKRETLTVRNLTQSTSLEVRLAVSPREREILLAGGVLNLERV